MKKLLKKGESVCRKKQYFSEQGFKREKSKLSGYYSILKSVLNDAVGKSDPFDYAKQEFKTRCSEIGAEFYALKKEKEFSDNIVSKRIEEMMDWLKENEFKLIGANKSGKLGLNPSIFRNTVQFNPVMVSATFQMVLERKGAYYLAMVEFDNNPYKSRGKNTPENSPEMLLEKMIADEVSSKTLGTKAIPMNLYVWGSDETKSARPEQAFNDEAKGNVVFYERSTQMAMDSLIAAILEHEGAKCEPSDYECSLCPYKDLCLYTKPSKDIKLVPIQLEKAHKNTVFTDDQLKFIHFTRGIARVLAGAGSGKTTSVVARVIYLLKNDGVEPCDFLLTTFTEKGIREIKEKLDYWLKVEGLPYSSDEFEITNFNTFGYQVVRENYRNLGFDTEPKMLDRSKKMHIIAEILDEKDEILGLNYYSPLMSSKNAGGALIKMANIIDDLKDHNVQDLKGFKTLFPVEKYGVVVGQEKRINEETGREKTYPVYGFDYESAFEVYQEFLKRTYGNGYIEYVDQVRLATKVLRKDETSRYNYKHIIIDEFQDSHEMEMKMIRLLYMNEDLRSLVVVGDDAQSIFSFRGVNMKNILEFPEVFPECRQFTLLDNFRSTQDILDLANTVIETSASNVHKKLVGKKSGKEPLLVLTNKEIPATKAKILEALKTNSPKDIAVIARTRKELVKVAEQLREEGIPYVMSVSEFINDSPVIAGVNGFLKFVQDPTLTYELSRYLIVADYETMKAQRELGAYVDERAQIIAEEIKQLDEATLYQYVMDKLSLITNEDPSAQVLFDAINEDGCQTLDEINNFVKRVMTYKTDLSVKASEENYDAITLTTVHAAKGREFKNVILLLDHFDFKRSGDEEIRLLFVAITRAMDTLVMIAHNFCHESLVMASDRHQINFVNENY